MSPRTHRPLLFAPCLVSILWLALPMPAVALEAQGAGGAGEARAAAAPSQPTWYARTRIATSFGPVVNHYWSKGPWLRSETVLSGHRVVTIVNSTHYYVYDLVLGEGVEVARAPKAIAEDEERGRPFGRELDALIEAGGELIHQGQSEAGGMPYKVYQLTNENGRRRISVTDSEPPLPINVETFVRSSGHNGLLEYSGWLRDIAIAESFFVPPAHIEWERLRYDEYNRRAPREAVGPAPIYFRHLLHGN